MKLLYAEDEAGMADAVVDILTYHNYQVDWVDNGQDALEYAQAEDYDGIILDIMMPQLSGLEVLEALRGAGCRTPILLLTAKTAVEDRVEGLDLGADDYLPKPFDSKELLARVRAMLRRRDSFQSDQIAYGDLTLDRDSCTLSSGNKAVSLSRLEFLLMETLMVNQGIYLSTETLLVKVWGYETDAEAGSVWVYLSYLRKRLAELNSRVTIQVKRGVGYRLEDGL